MVSRRRGVPSRLDGSLSDRISPDRSRAPSSFQCLHILLHAGSDGVPCNSASHRVHCVWVRSSNHHSAAVLITETVIQPSLGSSQYLCRLGPCWPPVPAMAIFTSRNSTPPYMQCLVRDISWFFVRHHENDRELVSATS